MSKYIALVPPRTWVQDSAGRCLPYAQSFFGAPIMHDYARQAFDAAKYKHLDWNWPSDVPSLLWFDHWGTYYSYSKGIYEYVNAGHVAILVPGVGIYTSPGYGYGSEIYQTIADIERVFNSKYIGWTEDINGLRVLQPNPNPTPPPVPDIPKEVKTSMYRPIKDKQQVLDPAKGWSVIRINEKNDVSIETKVGRHLASVQLNVEGPVDALIEFGLRIDTVDKNGKTISGKFAIAETFQIHKGETKKTLATILNLAKLTSGNQRLRVYAKSLGAKGVRIVQVRPTVAEV